MNKKKKILFLVTQSEFGGAQRFIYRLVINLNLNKYEILIGAGPEGDDENGLLFALEKKIATIHLLYLKRNINPLIDILGLLEIKKLIRKQKPDILLLCSTKTGILGSLAAHREGVKKIIYRIGGWTFNDPWPKWKKKIYIGLEKNSAKRMDIIINNAESDMRQAIMLGIKPRGKILTIHNGINGLEFLSKEKAKKELINLISNYSNSPDQIPKPNDQLIGCIANDYLTKGIKYLVEASKNIDAKLVIIGKGSSLGFIPDAYKYLKAFDVLVLPSVKEGFPWTVIEGMAAGVPIVATNVGAVVEIIENNKSGILVKPRDSKGLAKGIRQLLRNKHLREQLIKQAKIIVKQKFNLKKMLKDYEDLFIAN